MTQQTTLGSLRAPQQIQPVQAGFFDLQGFELLQRVAKAFATSSLVPKQFQDNLPNCMIALNLARRLGADELMVMQNLYIVHGNPGWSSKFLIASVNSCGRFETMRYEWKGEKGNNEYGCRAWTIEKSTGQRLDGIWVDWEMVRSEGWSERNGSKWKTMPDQMFIYRSAAFWQRAYAPEISMGLSSAEELADVIDVAPDGSFTVTSESLRTDIKTVNPEQATEQVSGVVEQVAANDVESEQRKQEVTYADVMEQMTRSFVAKDIDQLNTAADLIKSVSDKEQRVELRKEYNSFKSKLEAQ